MNWPLIKRETYAITIALLVAMAVGSVLILSVGESPARVYGLLVSKTWGDPTGIGQVIFHATPLIFTGLAVALAFRVGLFNIGGEGQAIAGAMATAVVAASMPGPSVVVIPVALAAGAAAGGVIGAIPGALKAWTGAHEVINTIMLNLIVIPVSLWIGNQGLFDRHTTHTAEIPTSTWLPNLGFEGSEANVAFLLAVATALGVWYFLERTRRGYDWRAAGLNPLAAEAGGVNLKAAVIGAMAASGAIAGLVGSNYVLGWRHYYQNGMVEGIGFMGIAVALLGRNNPAGVVAASLLFGTLAHGGVAISSHVPKDIVDVLQAVILLSLVASTAAVRHHMPLGRRA